ncbi:MAG TPA: XTP/dITP diphosphatase [Blastocatellia bacterium]|nr:XTP/dITP diphosphatase [Blastocatellia bacterium]
MKESTERKILIATGNPGKVAEIRDMLKDLPVEIIGLSSFPGIEEPEETGSTFEANALLKADYYHEKTGLLTVADDSGLCVDALDGRPGVYSARYGGPASNDKDRYRKLLEELKDVPTEKRTARFVCVAATVGDGIRQTRSGSAEGVILDSPRGEGGFGYDPVFFYPALNKTFAELTKEEKAAVSHRGKAFAKLIPIITECFTK